MTDAEFLNDGCPEDKECGLPHLDAARNKDNLTEGRKRTHIISSPKLRETRKMATTVKELNEQAKAEKKEQKAADRAKKMVESEAQKVAGKAKKAKNKAEKEAQNVADKAKKKEAKKKAAQKKQDKKDKEDKP